MAEFGPISFKTKTNQEIQFRSLLAQDASQLKDFFERIPSQTEYTLQYPGKPPQPIEYWQKRIESYLQGPGHLYLGAFHQDKLIGAIFFWQTAPDHPWIKHIGSFGLMVMQEQWGQGIATQLLKHLDTHARRMGITRIEADVRVENEVAIQLYLKSGYKIEGRKERSTLVDGSYKDCFYIAKDPSSAV